MQFRKKQTLLIMIFFLLTSTTLFAQISQNIDIKLEKVTLNSFLTAIESKTDYTFMYKNLDLTTPVTINAEQTRLSDILNQVLSPLNIEYEVSGKRIILKENSRAKPSVVKRDLTGTIMDEYGDPIIGANVVEKGTTNGVITDVYGKFTLSVAENAMLDISYIGYMTQSISVQNQTVFTITLKENAQTLDEVVVVGYGTLKKKDLTGAIGAVKGTDLAARKTTQLSTALQGAMAGVLVTRDNGAPGNTAGSVRVRGVTTIGDTSPLVIVDGVPGDINLVNPNDVESISVLKDAASASIYGARAAAGVIVVTTKRATENDLTMSYDFEYGLEIPTKQPDYVGVQRYLEMTNELRYNDNPSGGWFQTYTENQVNNWIKNNETDPNHYPITDWTDLILKKSAPRQTHSINIAGGNKVARTKASLTYDKIDGLYLDRYYERFMIRVNNDFKINKYIGAILDFNFRRTKDHQPVSNPFSDYYNIRSMPEIYAAMWTDGRIAEGKQGGGNPYGMLTKGGTQDNWNNKVGGKAALEITPINGLKISGIVAPVYTFSKAKTFSKAVSYTSPDNPDAIAGYLKTTTKLDEGRTDSYDITIQGLINYMKTLGKHDLNFMAGYETYYGFNENLTASRDQYELDSFPYLDLGPLSMRDNSGNAHEVAYRSYFGRVIYNYNNRYLFQANLRYDGSSRFHEDSRWGTFPSFSGGWVISEENFMKKINLDWLSFLKLRGSWGTLGNERIGNYPYQASINFLNVLFYQNGQPTSHLSAAQIAYAIRNISWETTQSLDFGLDAQLFRNRLRFTADVYKKTTKDMLLALEIPDYVGFNNPQKNTGDMNTKGYDMEIAWNDVVNDWSYGVSVNFSDFVSKMGNLGGTQFLGDQVKMEGSEFNEWYGYLNDGLYLAQEDVDNSAKLNNNVQVGDVKYKDISGPDGVPDGKISSEYDRVLLGGALPRYMFGGTINAAYKGIDFSMAFQGVGSQNVRLNTNMVQPLQNNWGNIPAIIDGHYWSSKNTDEVNAKSKYPRLTYANQNADYAMSDFWLFNGRYFRLKNLTLGYTLPQPLTKKVSVNRVRVYISANDLFSINNFPKGWDPEMSASNYPITTSMLFGVSVNF